MKTEVLGSSQVMKHPFCDSEMSRLQVGILLSKRVDNVGDVRVHVDREID